MFYKGTLSQTCRVGQQRQARLSGHRRRVREGGVRESDTHAKDSAQHGRQQSYRLQSPPPPPSSSPPPRHSSQCWLGRLPLGRQWRVNGGGRLEWRRSALEHDERDDELDDLGTAQDTLAHGALAHALQQQWHHLRASLSHQLPHALAQRLRQLQLRNHHHTGGSNFFNVNTVGTSRCHDHIDNTNSITATIFNYDVQSINRYDWQARHWRWPYAKRVEWWRHSWFRRGRLRPRRSRSGAEWQRWVASFAHAVQLQQHIVHKSLVGADIGGGRSARRQLVLVDQ